jgi:trehalose 6-phosphate synthase
MGEGPPLASDCVPGSNASPVVVVSNRGPVSFRLDGGGRPVASAAGGGLAGTLGPLLAGTETTWVAAAMSPADRLAAEQGAQTVAGLRVVSVVAEPAIYAQAYDVVANATLWFCHHHLFDLARRPRLDRHWYAAFDAYRALNEQFADVVAAESPEGAVVLVQDYHLSLAGAMLAKRRDDLRTVHFHHTPFADPNVLRVLPETAAGELLAGLAGFGACGFHTARWASGFSRCFEDPLLARAAGRRAPAIFAAPLGPTPAALAAAARSDETTAARRRLEGIVGDRRLILRVDRIELSKNLLRGLFAYEALLEERAHWRERVVLLALAYPSRQDLAEYIGYRAEVEHTVERINERFGTEGWTPIIFDPEDDYPRSVAALGTYDVLLVNPVRDGMNMVAKEGPLLNTTDGVLVLSHEAGAYEELGAAAVGVNPFDVQATAAALDQALDMAPDERQARASALRSLVEARSGADWLDDQLRAAL